MVTKLVGYLTMSQNAFIEHIESAGVDISCCHSQTHLGIMQPMSLHTQQLACRQGDRLLFDSLDFEVNEGELLLIEGHNGSGKTTLLKTLATLRQPDEGKISWKGQSIHKLGDEYRSELTWLGHHNGIKLDLTALENLRIQCALNGAGVSESDLLQALEQMGLYGYEDLPARVLSQGQKRRTALAYLLLTKAPLWILDEPFTALDVKAVDFLQGIVSQHVDQGGIAILTTHQEVGLTAGQINRLNLAA